MMSIAEGDLVIAVESDNLPAPVKGICQAGKNAWESYRFDDPDVFDYAHTVCFPVKWFDWDLMGEIPPNQPARFAGVKKVGDDQTKRICELWEKSFL